MTPAKLAFGKSLLGGEALERSEREIFIENLLV